MISSFKQFWKDLFSLVWFALKIGLGLLIAVWLIRFLLVPRFSVALPLSTG